LSHHSHSLAMRLEGVQGDADFYLIANAYSEPLSFELPGDARWRRLVDTSLAPPQDWIDEDHAPLASGHYDVAARTIVLLMADVA